MMFTGTLGLRETRDREQLCNVKGQTQSEDGMTETDMTVGADGSGIFQE